MSENYDSGIGVCTSTFSFAVVVFCVLRLFLNALVTDLHHTYRVWAAQTHIFSEYCFVIVRLKSKRSE